MNYSYMDRYGSIPDSISQKSKSQKNAYSMIVTLRVIKKDKIKQYVGDTTIKKDREMINT